MKIVSISEGIPITYNTSEINIETIFGLDENDKLIQHFTFDVHLDVNNEIFENKIKKCYLNDIKYIENGFLFYSFSYQVAFCHYMTQTVPKLYEYLELQNYINYKLLIPKNTYNNLCKDILQCMNINNIEIMEDNTIYIIDNFVKSNKYLAPPDNYSASHLYVYKKIRESLYIHPNSDAYKKIYIKRDGKPNIDYGNNETGIKRQLLNEEELIENLLKMDFQIITLGNKSLFEKKILLEDSKIIITPLGANCMNFIFSNAPKNILLLSNNENFGEEYYINLCSELNNEIINYKILRYSSILSDSLNKWNASFSVNIEEIKTCIESFDI
jgi:capsular polysaccharide biosynthesis protein